MIRDSNGGSITSVFCCSFFSSFSDFPYLGKQKHQGKVPAARSVNERLGSVQWCGFVHTALEVPLSLKGQVGQQRGSSPFVEARSDVAPK